MQFEDKNKKYVHKSLLQKNKLKMSYSYHSTKTINT